MPLFKLIVLILNKIFKTIIKFHSLILLINNYDNLCLKIVIKDVKIISVIHFIVTMHKTISGSTLGTQPGSQCILVASNNKEVRSFTYYII